MEGAPDIESSYVRTVEIKEITFAIGKVKNSKRKTQQSPLGLYHGPFVVTRDMTFLHDKNLSIVSCTLERMFTGRP